jgi:hypothetical protein
MNTTTAKATNNAKDDFILVNLISGPKPFGARIACSLAESGMLLPI